MFDLVRSKNSVVSYPALLLHMNLSHKQRFEGLVKEDAVKEVIFFFLFLSIETHKDHRLVFFFPSWTVSACMVERMFTLSPSSSHSGCTNKHNFWSVLPPGKVFKHMLSVLKVFQRVEG